MKTRFILGEALSGLTRNITMTVAMVITTAISLALLASGLLVTEMTANTKDMYSTNPSAPTTPPAAPSRAAASSTR